MPLITVIIVTYNGIDWIRDCLGSLEQSSMTISTIVVDNASNDGTQQLIDKDFPQIELIRLRENIGFGKANNLGIKKAVEYGTDYILLLNQDTKVEPDTINILCEAWNKNFLDQSAILSPLQTSYDSDRLDNDITFYLSKTQFPTDLAQDTVKDIYDIPFMPAACWFFAKKTWLEIGAFNPVFFCYGEDTDYVNRLKYYGGRLGLVPKAKVRHQHSHSGTTRRVFKLETEYLFSNSSQRLMNPYNQYFCLLLLRINCGYTKVFIKQFFTGKFYDAACNVIATILVWRKILIIYSCWKKVKSKTAGLYINE